MALRVCLLLFALPGVLRAEEVWVFLDDGRAGKADTSRDPVLVRLPDQSTVSVQKKFLLFQRTQQQINDGVAAMIAEIAEGKNLEENGKRFRILGAAAHENLRACLGSNDPKKKTAAIYALRYSWIPGIETEVASAFDAGDYALRQQALMALWGHLKESAAAEFVRKYADDPDEKTAALVFNLADRYFPDPTLARIRRLLKSEALREAALPRLSHYYTRELTADLRPLLEFQSAWLKRCAMIGLISQLANDGGTRQAMLQRLQDESPDIRETAAEYFTWLGDSQDLDTLKQAQIEEQDFYTRAAVTAAIAAIERRAKTGDAAFRKEIDGIAATSTLEPLLVYEVHEHKEQTAFIARNSALQRAILGYSITSGAPAAKNQYPVARAWLPPVRDYFDQNRKSYGVAVGNRHATFSNSVHIGDDCAWGDELRTVVAAADGIVRSASHIRSWGYIVVVEHRTPARDTFCTVYAHLSPLIHVCPGDIVTAGQKLGSVGRTNSVENGGYYAHLHFGVHQGPYSSNGNQWICGYISTQAWQSGVHGWLSPQIFLKSRLPEATERK